MRYQCEPRITIPAMKLIFSIITLIISSVSVFALDIEKNTQELASQDYELRQDALDRLASAVAQASDPDADQDNRKALEKSILTRVLDSDLPEETRIYYTRALTKVASEESIEALLELIAKDKAPDLVIENAFACLSQAPGEAVTAQLVEAFIEAPESQADYFWSTLATRRDSSANSKILQALQSGKIELNDSALLSISIIGDTKMSAYLFNQWSEAESAQKDAIAKALLTIGQANAKQLGSLVDEHASSVILAAAFSQWFYKAEAQAIDKLWDKMDQTPETAPILVSAATKAGSVQVWKSLYSKSSELPEQALMTLIRATAEFQQPGFELEVIELLNSDSVAIQIEATRCLGYIGTGKSSEALMQQMTSKNEALQDATFTALGMLHDYGLDARILEQVEAMDASTIGALQVLAVRNSPGSLKLLNSYVGKDLEKGIQSELLDALVKIGDETTCKLLALDIIGLKETENLKSIQVALKRLTLRLERSEYLWETCFLPALTLAPDDATKARMLVILDAISTPAALQYCVGMKNSSSDVLQKAASQALIRWRSVDICDYWLEIVNDEDNSEKDRKQAAGYVFRNIAADYMKESDNDRAVKAAELFIQTTDSEIREGLITSVKKLGKWPSRRFKRNLQTYLEMSDYRDTIFEMAEED